MPPPKDSPSKDLTPPGSSLPRPSSPSAAPDIEARLEARLGRLHARQRLGIETDVEQRAFGQGLNFFHIENWRPAPGVIRKTLKLSGLYWRGEKNAGKVEVRRNRVRLAGLDPAFEGYTILHISDLHVDMNPRAMARLVELLRDLAYDAAVLTGDYRGRTFGSCDATLEGLAEISRHFTAPAYGVLGNHDSVRMVPPMEEMGIRMLLNEAEVLKRGEARLHLAGIDDAHYFRVDNIEKVAERLPHGECSILLSHTPEIYRQAAHADFDLLLAGHTHGGQICLPGSIPITLDSKLPRRYGSGAWRYNAMQGYTTVGVGASIVPVRFNCPPEIVLHRLEPA
jgi:predicted MPP superfamily phosphohydrolase